MNADRVWTALVVSCALSATAFAQGKAPASKRPPASVPSTSAPIATPPSPDNNQPTAGPIGPASKDLTGRVATDEEARAEIDAATSAAAKGQGYDPKNAKEAAVGPIDAERSAAYVKIGAVKPKEIEVRVRGPNLSNSVAPSREFDVAVSGKHVYVVWTEGTFPEEIFFAVSDDAGGSFWPGFNISNTATRSRNPRIAANGDRVYIVWEEEVKKTNTEIFYAGSKDRGINLSSPVNVSAGDGASTQPRVAAAGERGFVVWSDRRAGVADIFVGRLDALESNLVIATKRDKLNPDIAAYGNYVHVIAETNTGSERDPIYALSQDSGASFQVEGVDGRYGKESTRTQDGDQHNFRLFATDGKAGVLYETAQRGNRAILGAIGGPLCLLTKQDCLQTRVHSVSRFAMDPSSTAFRAPLDHEVIVDPTGRYQFVAVATAKVAGGSPDYTWIGAGGVGREGRLDSQATGRERDPQIRLANPALAYNNRQPEYPNTIYEVHEAGKPSYIAVNRVRISTESGEAKNPRIFLVNGNVVSFWEQTTKSPEIYFSTRRE